MGDNSPQVKQLRAIQEMVNNRPQAIQADRLQAKANNYSTQQQSVQKRADKTDLPGNLTSGIENPSGYSMDDVTPDDVTPI